MHNTSVANLPKKLQTKMHLSGCCAVFLLACLLRAVSPGAGRECTETRLEHRDCTCGLWHRDVVRQCHNQHTVFEPEARLEVFANETCPFECANGGKLIVHPGPPLRRQCLCAKGFSGLCCQIGEPIEPITYRDAQIVHASPTHACSCQACRPSSKISFAHAMQCCSLMKSTRVRFPCRESRVWRKPLCPAGRDHYASVSQQLPKQSQVRVEDLDEPRQADSTRSERRGIRSATGHKHLQLQQRLAGRSRWHRQTRAQLRTVLRERHAKTSDGPKHREASLRRVPIELAGEAKGIQAPVQDIPGG